MATAGAHPFSLEAKTILIAGGASGIGASAAAICAGLGAKLILADVGDATPVADKLRREGHQASAASVMGPMRSSPPSDRHAAELTLLSVVDAKAATLCC